MDKSQVNQDFLKQALIKAVWAALEAEIPIMEVYETKFSVEYKSDSSPVTEADRRANEVIRTILLEDSSEIPVLTEESREIPYGDRKEWSLFWVVDPLDGTKEFVSRNGEFTVNIAMVSDCKPVAGVVFAPATGDLYFGASCLGAYKIAAKESRQSISNAKSFEELTSEAVCLESFTQEDSSAPKSEKYVVIGSRSHPSPEFEQFVREKRDLYGEVQVISLGSALKLCAVAEGVADVYPRLGPTMEWDTAAGHAIVNAVGKRVLCADTGEELLYNKESLLNPWFIVE